MLSERALRWRQVIAWTVLGLFVAGFFSMTIGGITRRLLALWFVGTQRPLRGFCWMLALEMVPHLFESWGTFKPASVGEWATYFGWIAVASVIGVLPFTFHRLTSRYMPGPFWTLPFPLAYAFAQTAVVFMVPVAGLAFIGRDPNASLHLLTAANFTGVGPILYEFSGLLIAAKWPVAALLWLWNLELRGWRLIKALIAIAAFTFVFRVPNLYPIERLLRWRGFFYISLVGVVAIALWALIARLRQRAWDSDAATTGILRSPITGEPLSFVKEHGQGELESKSGERFPIRNGIAQLLRPEDLTGMNKKYNLLYETIGGFYDDTQRVGCALMGMDRDAYVMGYMGLLEVKAGDRVLETSVGTGLNYKYLPRGVELHGLDLSREMLDNCHENLRRWGLKGTLVLGNAERLPYADESFDVVFHVGGINFFSDRGAAIREMIRVAKPGTRILIADETEEHVKAAYENIPYTQEFFKDRKEAVAAPVDLVPAEMLEVREQTLKIKGKNRFYALTFRKPAAG